MSIHFVLFVFFLTGIVETVSSPSVIWSTKDNLFNVSLPICSDTLVTTPTPLSPCDIGQLGMAVPGPAHREDCFPRWMNIEKLVLAQKYLKKGWGGVGLAQTIILPHLLSIPSMGETLVFTATHDCPILARRRYTTTVKNILLWMNTDITVPGNSDIILESFRNVRLVHLHVANRFRNVGNLREKLVFPHQESDERIWAALKRDLKLSYKAELLQPSKCYLNGLKTYQYMNQYEFAMTLWSSATIYTMPKLRGLMTQATVEELEALIHFWAVTGYMVGLEDRFNIALQSSIEETEVYFKGISKLYVVPSLYNIDKVSKYLLEMTSERTTPYLQKSLNLPNLLPLDAWLGTTLQMGLNIPSSNLYREATTFSKIMINTLRSVSRKDQSPSGFEPLMKSAFNSVHNSWGKNSWGKYYREYTKTNENIAMSMHYYYDGPDVNPNGIYSNCSIYEKDE